MAARCLLLLVLPMLGAACSLTDIAGGPKEQRQAAEQTVTEVAKARFPGQPAEPIANCIVDNASKDEITVLAEGAARGISGGLSQYVMTMSRRPEVQACIASNGVSGLS